MNYEYKDYFKRLNIEESRKVGSDLNDIFNARDELIEVYRKAEAFDLIVEQRKKTGVITLGHYAWKVIREYENGEQAAWEIIKEWDGENA